jgi:hypothetical protein
MLNSIWKRLQQELQLENSETIKENMTNLLRGNRSQNMQLGIWGTTGAGKSTFLTALYKDLLRTERWRIAADEKARKYLNQQLEIMENGRFVAGTPEGKIDIYEYWLTGTEKDSRFKGLNVTLKFIDAPGGFYEEPSKGAGKIAGGDILDYLCSCDGIVFLLDPKRPKTRKKLSLLLLELMQEFQQRSFETSPQQQRKIRALEQYMAFCVTKADQDDRLWQNGELGRLPEQLVREILGDDPYDRLERNFCQKNRFQCFPISAVGRYRDEDGRLRSPIQNPETEQLSSLSSTDPAWWEQAFSQSDSSPSNAAKINTVNVDDFGVPINSDRSENRETPLQQQIDVSKNCRPMNVLESVEWLIEGIQKNPPALPPRKSNLSAS